MFWRIICLITNKLDNCLILIIVGFILIWRNTWLLYINVNNVGFYSSFISVLPFSLFSASPNVRFFIAPSESLCFWTANLFRWMDTKEFRSSPFVPKKITPDGFAVPNIFCRPKLFLIPPSLLLCAVKKRLINSDGAWKLKKKVGRKKRPSRKGVLKKGL